jgi:hypothetical protein
MKPFCKKFGDRWIACLLFLSAINVCFSQTQSTSMNTTAGLLNFTSQEPTEIIFEMSRIRKRILLGEQIEMPEVTLILWPEGTRVSGFILDVKSEKDNHHIAIQLTGGSRDIFYAYMGAVRGVVVHNIENYEYLLTDVSAGTAMNTTPAFTRLDMRKRLDSESKSLSKATNTAVEYVWEGEFPEGAVPLFVIGNLITDMTISLKDIAQTDLGKEAIAESISKITFHKTDAEFSIVRKNKELIVNGNFKKSFTTSQGRWKLKEMLEGML